MRINIRNFAIILLLATAALINPMQLSAQQEEVDFQVFYNALSPYGQWVDYRDYGYVWIPDVGPEFAPYSTDGYWVLTDYGWTWVSDYEWGWAPFHYGRWSYDNYYGWLWVPDNEWGPSWVNWRRAEGYYGWSPMEPGISISLSFGRPYNSYNDHWMFVRDRDFERRDIYRYSVDRSDHAMIIRNSTVINTTYIDNSRHTTYVTGPSRNDVQRVTGRRINPVSIQENNRPGRDMNDGNLRMYRPQVAKNNRQENKPAPGNVENLRNIKPPSERTGNLQPRELNQKNNHDSRPTQQRDATHLDNKERQQQKNQQEQQRQEQQKQQQPQQATPAGDNERRQQQQQQNQQEQQRQQQQKQQQRQQATPASNNERQQQQQQQNQQEQQRQQQQKQQRQQVTPASNNERQQRQQQQNQQEQQRQQQQKQQQPQQTTPASNNERQQRQQQQNQQEQQRQQQQKQQQPQQTTPASNNQRQQQQNASPQKSNNLPQPAQQQQRAAPATNRQNQQPQNVQKQQNQQMKEKEKAKEPGEEKKQNN